MSHHAQRRIRPSHEPRSEFGGLYDVEDVDDGTYDIHLRRPPRGTIPRIELVSIEDVDITRIAAPDQQDDLTDEDLAEEYAALVAADPAPPIESGTDNPYAGYEPEYELPLFDGDSGTDEPDDFNDWPVCR